MTRLHVAPVSQFETAPSPLLTPEQAPRPDANQSIDSFSDGIHEAVFTIANVGGAKEGVEEVYLTRKNHLRAGEKLLLVEPEESASVVLHQQFNILASVQAVISDLNHRGIEVDLEFNWGN